MRLVVLALLMVASVYGATPKEESLTRQLAEANAQLAAQARTAKAVATLAEETRSVAEKADAVRQAQNQNAGTAQKAVEEAKATAADQQATNEALLRTAENSRLTQWGAILGTLAGLVGLFWKGYIDNRNHKWERDKEREANKKDVAETIVSQMKTTSADIAIQETGMVARLATMTAQYLLTRTRELPVMRLALEHGDFGTLVWVTHNLAGTATSFGYPEMSRLGKLMEIASRAGDRTQLESLLEMFSAYVHSVPSPDLTTLSLS